MGKLRYDIGRLQPVRRMPNGTIVADAHLTRAGVFEYRNPDGSTRRELRLPEEVFRPDSMRTFAMVPTTDDHPPEMIDATNAIKFAKGATGETITRDDDHMRGSIAVFDASTIKKMEMGKLQLSCGYTCDLDEIPGVHALWGKYDAIQRNIVGNHVALVEHGRAGSTASVRMDAAVQLDGEWDEGAHPRGPGGKFGDGEGVNSQSAAKGVATATEHEGHAQAAIAAGKLRVAQEHVHLAEGGAAGARFSANIAQQNKAPDAALAAAHAAQAERTAATARQALEAARPIVTTGPPAKLGPADVKRAQKTIEGVALELKATRGVAGLEQLAKASPERLQRVIVEQTRNEMHAQERALESGRPMALKARAEHEAGVASGKLAGTRVVTSREFAEGHEARVAKSEKALSALTKFHDKIVSGPLPDSVRYQAPARKDESDALGVPFSGPSLARSKTRGTVVARSMASIPNARIELVVRHDDEQVDPDDLANRNARGENDDEQPAGPPDDPDPSYEGEGSEMDASYGGMYDDDGNLSESGASRVAASSFAVPGKSKLPIHDPKAVRDSMKRFGGHSFDDADEKHGAFNRISGRAKQFGINCDAFRRAYSGKLDRKDQAMIDAKTQAKAAKADIRKKQRDEAIARADAADKELAAAQGKIESLTKDLELAKGGTEKTRTDAADKFDFAVAAKVDLVTKAAAVLGAKVDIKASDLDIMKAVIKHVDGKDVTDTRPGYVEALFDGAVERGRADAAAKVAGAQALGAARAAVITPAVVVPPVVPAAPAAAVPHADASVNDEANAAAAMRARTASLAFQANPQGTSKHAVIARQGRS